MDMQTTESTLVRAIRTVGSQTAFARLIGKSQQTVSDWVNFGRALPAEHVLRVEAATGISRHDLRPDIYPIESGAPGAGSPPASLPAGGAPSSREGVGG